MDEQNNNNNVETLEDPSQKNIKDIPRTFFRPIEEVQEKQEQIINSYEPPVQKERVPDLSDEVSRLEKKLNQKRLMMPFSLVLVIVILINIIWFLGVRFVIVPKYEEFTKVSDDLKKDYEDLKRKVNAIVGE